MTEQITPTAAEIARLGGITTEQAPDTAELQAITYTSPALGDRVVVRLAPTPLAVVEDLTAETFGLANAESTPVGFTRARASGFPAWPIMHDPDNARHALNLVGSLQRAGRTARSKPGAAKDEITKIGADLGKSAPHFLPTFYEEAARLFVAAGNQTYAAQFVGKAREAERVYGLAIDEQRHQAVMLEFALEGAVSAKELTAEAKSLPGRVAPDDAYQLFLRLNVERVKGGMPPYAGVLADLRKLGTAAGKKPIEADLDFLGQVVTAQSLRQAAAAFWDKAKPALVKLVQQDDAVASGLLAFLPAKVKIAAWIDVLRSLGLVDRLAADPEAARAWLQLMINQAESRWGADSEALVPVVLAWRDQLAGAEFHFVSRLALDTVDALLDVGARVELRGGRLDFNSWAGQSDRRDLTFIAGEPELAAAFSPPSWVRDQLPAVAAAHAGSREIVRGWLRSAAGRGGLTLPALEHRLFLGSWATSETYSTWQTEFDALYEGLDPAEITAENLRAGLTTELTHPALERAHAELKPRPGERSRWESDPDLVDQWPAIGVSMANRVRFIEGDDVVAAHDFPAQVEIDQAELVGTDIAVLTRNESYDAIRLWAGDEGRPVKIEAYSYSAAESSLPVAAGRLYADGLVTPGGKAYHNVPSGEVLSDGTHYWRLAKTCTELDPETGRAGRESMPAEIAAIVEQHAADGFVLDDATTYRPVTPATAGSLVSTAGNMHRCVVLVRRSDDRSTGEQRIVDADGTLFTWPPSGSARGATVSGVIKRPGGGVWLVTSGGELIDAETGWQLKRALIADADPHHLSRLPRHGWHQLRVRNEQASGRLRALTAADVRPLIEALATLPTPDELPRRSYWDPRYTYEAALPGSNAMSAAAALLGVDAGDTALHPLLTSVVMVAIEAIQTQRQASEIAGRSAGEPAADELVELAPLSKIVVTYRPSYTRRALDKVATALTTGSTHDECLDVAQFIGWESALVAMAAAPLRGADERAQLAQLGLDLAAAGFLTPELRSAVVAGLTHDTEGVWFAATPDGEPNMLRIEDTYSHSVVLFAGEAPTTVHGVPVTVVSGDRPDPEALGMALLQLRESNDTLEWNPAWATDLAAATGLTSAAAAILLVGLPNIGAYQKNFLPPEVRELLGLKVAEADLARSELRGLPIQTLIALLAAAVPTSDPGAYMTSGPDIAAMADMWRRLHAERITLPPAVVEEVKKIFATWGVNEIPEQLQHVPDAGTFDNYQAHLIPVFLTAMAERLALDDPVRSWVADRLEQYAAAYATAPQVPVTHTYSSQVRTLLGLPEPKDRNQSDRVEADGLILTGRYGGDEIAFSPAAAIAHPDVLIRLESLPVEDPPAVRRAALMHEFLTGDGVSETVTWLRTPGTGWARDPLAVAPDIVSAAATGLDVPPDSARYWLQLAALPNPTDRVVQEANGWTKAVRTKAAAPLQDKGLVVEAKRARAGRTLFLPGGWQEASAPNPPMEVWKAPFFGLAEAAKVTPILGAVTYLGSMPALFADAWQRYADGDTPGYEELRTQAYRRRRRR